MTATNHSTLMMMVDIGTPASRACVAISAQVSGQVLGLGAGMDYQQQAEISPDHEVDVGRS